MAGPLGSTPGIITGIAVGTATATALEPAIELARQNAWKGNQHRLLDPATMARLVAQGGVTLEAAQQSAEREGFSDDKTAALVYLAQTVPGFAEALTLWRRNPGVFDDLFTHALVKAGLDARYMPYLSQLKDDRLDPAIIATAIQRGIMHAPFPLPYNPDVPVGNITPFPTSGLDTAKEAEAAGINVERLRVQTALVGLPMALDRAARARFRDILTEGDYLRAVLEGNARGEWAQAELDVAREILTSGQYAELQLRGFYGRAERLANTAKHGMSEADSDLLYDVLGRAPGVHAITTGLARGGVFEGPVDTIPKVYLSSMQRSNVRPEYYSIEYANRYTYPGAFVLRALTEAGDITEAEVHQILLFEGWEPTLAATVAARWAAKSAATGKPNSWVVKAEQQLWTATHKAYIHDATGQFNPAPALTAIGIPAVEQGAIINLWDTEKNL